MNPSETINFYEEQSSLFGGGLETAISSGNGELAIFNVGQVFKAQVMQGLVTWRLGNDPTSFLRKAAEAVMAVVNGIDLSSLPADALPLERSGYIASLVGVNHCEVATDGLNGDRLLDAHIANDLLRHHPFTDQSALIQSLSSKVAQESYQLYNDLLLGKLGSEEGMKEGERLFEARKSDSFYSGGDEIEGGGEDNGVVVDFRLGAIFKKLGASANSTHTWRWS